MLRMGSKALTESLLDWQAAKAVARRACSRSSKEGAKGKTTTYVSTFKDPIALSIVVYLFTVIVIHTPCGSSSSGPGSRNANQRESDQQHSDMMIRDGTKPKPRTTHTTVPEVHSEEYDNDYGLRTEAVNDAPGSQDALDGQRRHSCL